MHPFIGQIILHTTESLLQHLGAMANTSASNEASGFPRNIKDRPITSHLTSIVSPIYLKPNC